jgi:hypothetical protein
MASRRIKPYRQSRLDGLCGTYALINALRLLCPRLDEDACEQVFCALNHEGGCGESDDCGAVRHDGWSRVGNRSRKGPSASRMCVGTQRPAWASTRQPLMRRFQTAWAVPKP